MTGLSEFLKRNGLAYLGVLAAFSASGFALLAGHKGWDAAGMTALFGFGFMAALWALRGRPVLDRSDPGRKPIFAIAMFGTVLAIAAALYVFGQHQPVRIDWLKILSLNLLLAPILFVLLESQTVGRTHDQ